MTTTTKVFVGNLSFKTKEDELQQQFEVAGKVIKANIITRGPRSLGYGFVELENETVAKKAVELLHKKEIDGRQINVEIAKPREEGEEAGSQPQSSQQTTSSPRGARGGPRGGFRGGFRGRGRGNFRGGRGGRGGFRGDRFEGERTPSTTTLFVSNLPYEWNDELFAKIFTDKGLTPKSVKLITSKGFGFVEFENEAAQQEALSKLDGVVVEGRELTVKIALTQPEPQGEGAPTTAAPKQEKSAEEKKTEKPKEDKKPKEEKPKDEKPKEDKPKEEKKPKESKPKEDKPKEEKKGEK